MNKLLAGTALCLLLGTAAFAQTPNNSTNNQTSSQQGNDRDKDSATQRAPDTAAQSRASGSSQNQHNQSSQNQPSQNQSSQNQSSPSQSSQNQSSGTAKDQPSGSAQNQSPPSSTAGQSSPERSSSPSQAQGNTPAQSGSSSPPSQAQTNAPATNQAPQGSGNTNTAQQPAPSNQSNTAQSHQTNVNASVNLNDQQRSRVSQSFARLNVQPVRNVNFSVSVGTVVPRDLHLQTVPADIVEIVPQYRGYSFFAVRDEIVIVDPATYKIVTVLPRSGGTAAAPAASQKKVTFTDKDRDVVRKHVRSSTERRTTGSSAARVEIRRGERVPDTVEIEEFPETVYREVPALREYRYIHRDSRTYVVEPTERRIIEEID